MEKIKSESELLIEAKSDFLHNASNLCGIAQAFANVMKNLMRLADLQNQSTEWVNTHEVTRLWIAKMSDLSGYEYLTISQKCDLFDN